MPGGEAPRLDTGPPSGRLAAWLSAGAAGLLGIPVAALGLAIQWILLPHAVSGAALVGLFGAALALGGWWLLAGALATARALRRQPRDVPVGLAIIARGGLVASVPGVAVLLGAAAAALRGAPPEMGWPALLVVAGVLSLPALLAAYVGLARQLGRGAFVGLDRQSAPPVDRRRVLWRHGWLLLGIALAGAPALIERPANRWPVTSAGSDAADDDAELVPLRYESGRQFRLYQSHGEFIELPLSCLGSTLPQGVWPAYFAVPESYPYLDYLGLRVPQDPRAIATLCRIATDPAIRPWMRVRAVSHLLAARDTPAVQAALKAVLEASVDVETQPQWEHDAPTTPALAALRQFDGPMGLQVPTDLIGTLQRLADRRDQLGTSARRVLGRALRPATAPAPPR